MSVSASRGSEAAIWKLEWATVRRGQGTSNTRLGVCVCGGYVHVCVLEKGCGKGENWVDVGCAVQAKWALMSMVAHGDPCCRTVISNRSFFFLKNFILLKFS